MTQGRASAADFVWALQTLCAVHRKPFERDLLLQQFPPPYNDAAVVRAARGLGFKCQLRDMNTAELQQLPLPLLVELKTTSTSTSSDAIDQPDDSVNATEIAPKDTACTFGLVIAVSETEVVWLPAQSEAPLTQPCDALAAQLTGRAYLMYPEAEALRDPDAAENSTSATPSFGFHWFVPELLKHRKVWHEVLGASLVIQLLALGLPLFTQAIIDKVVVQRTESTLIALGIGMTVFMQCWVPRCFSTCSGYRPGIFRTAQPA
jgi:subfamily B ATP-binding cassette protein HlyB/CyaB